MQDLPVRLKRSFEEVCLKYSAFFLVQVALYRYSVIVTQDTKLFCLFCQNARSVFHTGTCTNHLITDYFLVYPGGTRVHTCYIHVSSSFSTFKSFNFQPFFTRNPFHVRI